ncbi:MerR family transcriptional regulator [Saccharothrix xinjiangensis]|uniref:MerR family transcriptional regulator n=1 Tax=Saccharothrix xinjiangensis TaxID=204798 RepID=A0ABV9Y9W9_9PSEU
MHDNQLYPIGDVARRTGLSVSAVRFYADTGVIPPTGHTDAGYRLYDVDAIARLELVRTLRELGASLDDVRRLLADETSLHDLATTHLALVERQMRHLRARRAVLRTIVNQNTATGKVSLMHDLVSLSDDDRDRLLDRFWDEVTEGLTVHPAFAESLHRMRPYLPEEPTTEQLQAWIELADLVQDGEFRRSVREYFHNAFSSPRALDVTAPRIMELVERHRLLEVEAWEAQRAGSPPDSPQAREIAERLVASVAELIAGVAGQPLDEDGLAELRHSMAFPDPTSASHQHAERAVAGFTDLLDTYTSLMATINGTPQPDPQEAAESERWVAAALISAGALHEPAPDR